MIKITAEMDKALLSHEFLDYDIPKDRQFLKHYFNSPMQVAFLRYYLIFPCVSLFKNHTGWHCAKRRIFYMVAKFKSLTKVYDEAKESLTEEGMATLSALESGRFPYYERHQYEKGRKRHPNSNHKVPMSNRRRRKLFG